MKTSFEIVVPIAIGNFIYTPDIFLMQGQISSTLFEDPDSGLLYRQTPLPGIGAIMRIPYAARLRAMSSSNLLIVAIRTPSAGNISKKGYSRAYGCLYLGYMHTVFSQCLDDTPLLPSCSSKSTFTDEEWWSSSNSIEGR